MTILIVRLGAFGDILHSLPAAASLKLSFPRARLVWVTRPVWLPLFEGNPFIDQVVPIAPATSPPGAVRSKLWRGISHSLRTLKTIRPDLAVDIQGLLQSALVARASRPGALWGFDKHVAREPLASLLYSHRVHVSGPHRVERNLQLVSAMGANVLSDHAWVPEGSPEGDLPSAPFVLASPFAGWAGKQWPLESYADLGRRLCGHGVPLVLNVSPQQEQLVRGMRNVHTHVSFIPGLIHATRLAAAVVGVDSGPLHLAAALRKPGVALFGPTDPAATGPYGGTITVLRTEGVATTYRREKNVHASMQNLRPETVAAELQTCLETQQRAVSSDTPVRA